MKTVSLTKLTNIAMSCGGDKTHPVIIIDGHVKRWVGTGWVTERKATKKDKETYPLAI